jgi:hypothetical protein
VLVVDDGSTDDTVDIAKTFADKDARIRVIQKPNGGVASARNRGLQEARGAYVAPLDADDIWRPENLSRQVAALERADPSVAFSFANSFVIDELDRRRRPTGPVPARPSDYISLLRRNWVGNGSAAVFRREALIAIGGYDETLRARDAQGAEDWKVVLTLAARHPGLSLADELIGYRQLANSMSGDPTTMTRSTMIVIDEMRRVGPRIAPWHVWHARSTIHIYMFYPWIYAGRPMQALRGLVAAYVFNPLWFTQKETRDFLFRQLIPHLLSRAVRVFSRHDRRAGAGSDGL